jgi:hypothetical protein
MARQKVRLGRNPARPVGSLLAVSLCLAVGLLLISTGTALGLSGFASNGPAVRAQYPDAPDLQGAGPQPVVSSLGNVIYVTRKAERNLRREAARNPKAAAQQRVIEQKVTRMAIGALSSVAGLGASQSGSIALLVAGIVVLSVGGVLRWRRGLTQI